MKLFENKSERNKIFFICLILLVAIVIFSWAIEQLPLNKLFIKEQ